MARNPRGVAWVMTLLLLAGCLANCAEAIRRDPQPRRRGLAAATSHAATTAASHAATTAAAAQSASAADVIDTIGGRVVVPRSLLNVTVWPGPANLPGFVFPELSHGDHGIPALQAKPSFGIGVSGGGLRATLLALGWLRGMHALGHLQRARYLGSASGGSLANIFVSYTDPSRLAERLGAYVPPANASLAALQDLAPGTFVHTIASMENFYQTFLENLSRQSLGQEGDATAGAFARTISQNIFAPFGLQWFNSTVTAMGTRGRVHERVEAAAGALGLEVYRAMSSPETPFPLICGNVLDLNNRMPFNPVELTPLYMGAPGDYRAFDAPDGAIGGGLMEPLAMNARIVGAKPSPSAQPGQPTSVLVNSSYVVPLVSHLAVSGGIMAVELKDVMNARPGPDAKRAAILGQPFFDFFNFYDYEATTYPFADGGYLDNEGLWAMLRRKTKKIILFYAGPNGDTDIKNWTTGNTGISLAFGRCDDCYSYLGVPTNDTNAAAQVFESHEFDALFAAYQANAAAGRVNVYSARLNVLENRFMGVQGGWQADVMFVMNSRVGQWEEQLPADTRAELDASRNDPEYALRQAQHPLSTISLVDFPFVDISHFRYNPLAAGALANMATWQVMQLQDQIAAFLSDA